MNKRLLFLGLIILAVCVILIVSIITVNVISASDKQETDINIDTTRPNIVLKANGLINTQPKEYTLSNEDSTFIYNLVENLQYRNYTCDGLSNYYFSIDNISYGIEVYGDEIHILPYSKPQHEAVVTGENCEALKQILGKYPINRNSFVGTVLEETTKYMIVKPNEDEEESKSSDKIMINYGTDHKDYLYGVGRKVVIYYTGYIMETYPAQINSNEISIDGYNDFEITVKKSDNIEKRKILNNKDLDADKQDFNLYYYGLDEVTVKVDDKTMPLEEALRSGKVTLQGIVAKANKDLDAKVIKGDTYKDGGSAIYQYDTYTIIKCHRLDGNRDVYIGTKSMTLNNVER